jgi:hypothetical protein
MSKSAKTGRLGQTARMNRTIQAWTEAAGVTVGPLFRSINRHGQFQQVRLSAIDVAPVTKKLVAHAGLDPAKYAGHSLRAGAQRPRRSRALRSGRL